VAWSVSAVASGRPFYQGQPGLANPGAALSLSQAAGSSALSATTYYVQYDLAGALLGTAFQGRTTTGSSQASIAVSTAGNVIETSITLPTVPYGPAGQNSVAVAGGGVGVYVGTATNPVLLGTIQITSAGAVGGVTYSGSATSGLSATITGNVLSVTISAAANGGTAAQASNNAWTLLYTSPAPSSNVTGPSGTAILEETIVTNTTASAATVSLAMGGTGSAYQWLSGVSILANDGKLLTGTRTQIVASTGLYGTQGTSGAISVTISGSEVA
jgi:hypothetical protein